METTASAKLILIIEDDPAVQKDLDWSLRRHGYSVECAKAADEAITHWNNRLARRVALVVVDLSLPGGNGIEIVREVRRSDKDLPIIMLSGTSTPEQAAEAIKSGANDFLSRPFKFTDLHAAITKALEESSKAAEPRQDTISKMSMIEAGLNQVAASDVPVLLRGESGVGKEVLARRLHSKSTRGTKSFLKINCAALPSELLESELFGHERGAFTGADQLKLGLFELAEGGTILLDEIGDMDVRLQAKLLQVLQDHEFHRVGGKELIRVNVRILAATHRNLEESIQDGHFREDLYYRLNVIAICVPPLRERRTEIVSLAYHFWDKYAIVGSSPPEIPPLLMKALLDYHWPGNIRELENVIRRFLVLQNADLIAAELRSSNQRDSIRPVRKPPAVEAGANTGIAALAQFAAANKEAESQLILSALKSTNWNRRKAAATLGIDYRSLLYKMKRLSIAERSITHFASTAVSGSRPVLSG